jgi:multidrug efflux pump subunit AcrB
MFNPQPGARGSASAQHNVLARGGNMGNAKKVVKKATKKVSRSKSKFAGFVPPPPVAGGGLKSEPLSIKVKVAVDTEDMDTLRATADRVADAADRVAAAAKDITSPDDPNRKQLHRRVVLAIYDSEGVRISDASFDLTASDQLTSIVLGDAITSRIASGVR